MLRPLIGFLLVFLAGCTSVLSPADAVWIRIANDGAIAFDRVIVGFPSQDEDYGAIAAHSKSDYRRIEQAYRYAYIEVHRDGEKLLLQPIDYVGESQLSRGRYTYALEVDPLGSGLTLALRRDE